jgi:4-diphosphocytidyl-2-C-methyl-D-erythritol kinase
MTRAAEAELAPAKVNLALHVTGQRSDGYHLLDSLVAFAGVGDRLTAAPAEALSLTVTGPFAGEVPTDASNLVLKAARLIGPELSAAITLEKRLPVASGIGGGSADAAAALRALARLWRLPLPPAGAVIGLGADVPVCLSGVPARMEGIGERVTPLARGLPAHLVLANPGRAISTPAVFARLDRRDNPPLPPLPAFAAAADLAAWLGGTRNDLQAAAIGLVPEIAAVIDALARTQGCLLARMSGSGATCFGLFPDPAARDRAAAALGAAHPGWWVA